MADPKSLPVVWTSFALENALRIKNYIQVKFSMNEVDAFIHLLTSFEMAVSVYPNLYPASIARKDIRRAVLNKNLSVFYRVSKERIEVLFVQDNRCDLSDWL